MMGMRFGFFKFLILSALLLPYYAIAAPSMVDAERQIRSGDLPGAVKTLVSITEHEPSNNSAHLLLGNIYFELRDYPKAISEYEKILSGDPKNLSALTNEGVAWRESGDTKKAIQLLRKAETINPQFLPAHENLAVLYENTGDLNHEIEEYKTILTLRPNASKTLLDLANLYEKNKQYAAGEKIYKDYLRNNPGDAEAWGNLAELFLDRKNSAGAWNAAERALFLEPSKIKILLVHARAAMAIGGKRGLSAAAADAQTVLAMDPTNSEAGGIFVKANEKLLAKKQYRLFEFGTVFIGIAAAGVLLFNRRKKKRAMAELRTFSDFTDELNKLQEIDEIGEFILIYFSALFGLPSGIFFLINPEKTEMKSAYTNQKILLSDTVSIDSGLIDSWILEAKGRPIPLTGAVSSKTRDVFPEGKTFFEQHKIELLLPFYQKGKPLAILALGGAGKRDFRKKILKIRGLADRAALLAEKAALAIERSILYELSVIDEQTKVYNKRHFRQLLSEEIKRVEHYHQPTSLLMIDIDHFKELNDSYGHQAGDSVLKEIAEILKDNVRSGMDAVSRYGGEEFTIILPVTPVSKALETAERIRKSVSSREFSEIPPDERVTISVGVATIPDHAGSDWELIQSADKALYESKKNGRNQATVGVREESRNAAPFERRGSESLRIERSSDSDKRQLDDLLTKSGVQGTSLSVVYIAEENQATPESADSPFSRVTDLLRALLTADSISFSLNPRTMVFLIPNRQKNEVVEIVNGIFHSVKQNSADMNWNELGIRAGIASFPHDGKTPDLLLAKAKSAWSMARTKGVLANPTSSSS